jgi:ABC-type transport system substrate-binding protein
MNTPFPTVSRRLVLAGLAAMLTLGACSSAAAPAASSSPPTASPAPSAATPVPSDGASPSDPDTSVGGSSDPGPGDPGSGQPALVIPKPGQQNLRPLPAGKLEATVDGRRVLVKATWWSGVEPCNVLDSVKVERLAEDIAITIIEGTSDPNAMCIEIATEKATIIDLGELEPGTYRITSPGGEAPPVSVTVS